MGVIGAAGAEPGHSGQQSGDSAMREAADPWGDGDYCRPTWWRRAGSFTINRNGCPAGSVVRGALLVGRANHQQYFIHPPVRRAAHLEKLTGAAWPLRPCAAHCGASDVRNAVITSRRLMDR